MRQCACLFPKHNAHRCIWFNDNISPKQAYPPLASNTDGHVFHINLTKLNIIIITTRYTWLISITAYKPFASSHPSRIHPCGRLSMDMASTCRVCTANHHQNYRYRRHQQWSCHHSRCQRQMERLSWTGNGCFLLGCCATADEDTFKGFLYSIGDIVHGTCAELEGVWNSTHISFEDW